MTTSGQTRAAPTAPAVSAVHALGASSLLGRAVGEGALELEHSAADLVLEGGLALLVVDRGGGVVGAVGARGLGAGAAEETSATAGGGRGALGCERHGGGLFV